MSLSHVAAKPQATLEALRYNPVVLQMPLVPGMRLGPYEILAAIGAGGMGKSTEPATRGSHATLPSKFFHSCLRPIHPHWRDSNAKPRCSRRCDTPIFWLFTISAFRTSPRMR